MLNDNDRRPNDNRQLSTPCVDRTRQRQRATTTEETVTTLILTPATTDHLKEIQEHPFAELFLRKKRDPQLAEQLKNQKVPKRTSPAYVPEKIKSKKKTKMEDQLVGSAADRGLTSSRGTFFVGTDAAHLICQHPNWACGGRHWWRCGTNPHPDLDPPTGIHRKGQGGFQDTGQG